MELNFEDLEMQKWNITTNKARRDGKKGVICLVIMFTPWVMIIKMLKMVHFFYFLLMLAKISHNLDKTFTGIWKILFSSLRKCHGLLDSELASAIYQPLKIEFHYFFADSAVLWYFIPWYLTNSNTKTYEPFSENSKRSFRCTF